MTQMQQQGKITLIIKTKIHLNSETLYNLSFLILHSLKKSNEQK